MTGRRHAATLKVVAGALVVLGATGFVAATQAKSKNTVAHAEYKERGTHGLAVPVRRGQAYTVFAWGRDEELGFEPARLDASVRVIGADGRQVLLDKALVASAMQADETGGVKRAQHGAQHEGHADRDGVWLVQVELRAGDIVTVDVFRDLPTWLNLAPGLAVVLGLVGVVLFFKAQRAAT
jgi:hypothetical protein